MTEAAWSSSLAASEAVSGPAEPSPFKWPLVIYLAVVIGAPYLTWKLVRSAGVQEDPEEKKTEQWMKGYFETNSNKFP